MVNWFHKQRPPFGSPFDASILVDSSQTRDVNLYSLSLFTLIISVLTKKFNRFIEKRGGQTLLL